MATFDRADNSLLGRWWWTVDRWTLGAIGTLIGVGYIMMLAATPAVAERIGTNREMFIFKQVVFLALAGAVIVGVSLLTPRAIRRLAIIGCLVALIMTAATMVIGTEIKGARRWITLPLISLQPSEFLKPFFAVAAGWLIAEGRRTARFPGMLIAFAVFGLIVGLLKLQPDIGMMGVIVAVFLAQLFVNGLHVVLVGAAAGVVSGVAVFAYSFFPHVRSRVDRFWYGEGDDYQVRTALEAFGNGGLMGRGPGEGRVKDSLPDAHADFIFAVVGEEFGMVICLVILMIFAFIVMRGLLRLLREHDPFVVLACSGLVTGFGLQAFINMASTLKLIPTKGMTLPFVSYGGSSVLAVAIGMGMLLGLTRRRHREDEFVSDVLANTHALRGDGMGAAINTDRAVAPLPPAPSLKPRAGVMAATTTHPIVIAAGGTGGHFFPAEALAAELIERGHRIVLMTDARSGGLRSAVFSDRDHFVLQGSGIAGRGAIKAAKSVIALLAGIRQARRIMRDLHPAVVVGFGGYPAVAPVVAAAFSRPRPAIILHEQNGVLGRANRMLSRWCATLALSLRATTRVPYGTRTEVTGNPVRPEIRALVGPFYTPPNAEIRLLVLGGSLGARVFSDVVPAALVALPDALRTRLSITQQCRAEDMDRVRAAYDAAGIRADLAPFFRNVAVRLASAHLVIARAGASTVAEIAVAGRPAILVPLPGAIDNHQEANARALSGIQAAWMIRQPAFTAAALTEHLAALLIDPTGLALVAQAAQAAARPDAAARLADLVEAHMHQEARS